MEMEKLEWVTIMYPITDFAPVGKVITQRDILEKYKADNPGQEIKALTGFKCDQQDKTVSLRIGVADSTIVADSGTAAKITLTGADGSKIEGERAEDGVRGDSADNIKFQREYDAIVVLYDKLEVRYSELIEKYDALLEEVRTLRLKAAGREELSKENDRLKAENSDLREALYDEAAGNKEPVTDKDTNTVLTEIIIKKACDQAEVVGPDEVKSASIPTPDELADAAVKVAESKVTGKPLLAPRKEITIDEAKERYNIADSFNHDTDLSPVGEDENE